MGEAQVLFSNEEGAQKEGFRFRILLLPAIEFRQIVQRSGYQWVICPQRLRPDVQRSLIKWFRLRVPLLLHVEKRQIVERESQRGVIGVPSLLKDVQRSLI